MALAEVEHAYESQNQHQQPDEDEELGGPLLIEQLEGNGITSGDINKLA